MMTFFPDFIKTGVNTRGVIFEEFAGCENRSRALAILRGVITAVLVTIVLCTNFTYELFR
jgi:hypothetical protein